MTPIETDESPPSNARSMIAKVKEWLAVPANVTRGWLLLSVVLGFVFLGCAIYAAIQTIKLDNRVTQEQVAEAITQQVNTCVNTNLRRLENLEVAELDIEADQSALLNDRENWDAIDAIFDNGIPEPARATIYAGLDDRQAKIESRRIKVASAYRPTDCNLITDVVSSPAN